MRLYKEASVKSVFVFIILEFAREVELYMLKVLLCH